MKEMILRATNPAHSVISIKFDIYNLKISQYDPHMILPWIVLYKKKLRLRMSNSPLPVSAAKYREISSKAKADTKYRMPCNNAYENMQAL